MIQEVTNFARGRHPDHLYVKVRSSLEDYHRLLKMMNHFIPKGFSVVNEPGVVQKPITEDQKRVFYEKMARGRDEYFYGIRVFINPELKKFALYRHLLAKAMIRKLSR